MHLPKVFIYFLFSLILLPVIAQAQVANDYFVIDRIEIEGNKRTKTDVILREIELQINDTVLVSEKQDRLQSLQNNLMNTSLFNFVNAEFQETQNKIVLFISVVERWYIWPSPILNYADRNFNEFLKFRDWSRIDYGFSITHNNFRGRNEKLTGSFKWGYNRFLGVEYVIPFVNTSKTYGLFFELSKQWNHEVSLKVENNFNEFLNLSNRYAISSLISRAGIIYRANIHNTHIANFKYENVIIDDTILYMNPNFLPSSQLKYISFEYKFKHDYRNYAPYPLKGYYIDFEFEKNGFNVFPNSDIDYFIAKSTSRKYFDSENFKNLYAAIGFIGLYSNKPEGLFYNFNGLGYGRDFIRGFEYQLIEGKSYAIIKSNIKWNFIPEREIHFKGIKTNQFHPIPFAAYLNVFFDGGKTWHNNPQSINSLQNKYLYGYGIGLDIVSYYDKVFRFEYAINSIRENAIFIHFIAPI